MNKIIFVKGALSMIREAVMLLVILMAAGCTGRSHDERIVRIAEMVSDEPHEAIARLDSINPASLTESDRHFYDFLKIKANDKAYITHTNDSLIQNVLKYYQSHRNEILYSEVLYYAGRVYCDIGDAPRALEYFHRALDSMADDNLHPKLKLCILSQTGGLLTDLRIYNQAAEYIKAALEIEREINDTTHLIYDLQLLGGTYMNAENYRKAEYYLNKSLDLSSHYSEYLSMTSRMYLANCKFQQGDVKSALALIRNIPESVDSLSGNVALSYASKIYLHGGIPDTSYMYADKLIHSHDPLNRESGYHVILSPELRKFLPPDSIYVYIADYVDLLETYYDETSQLSSINQQNLYNYQLHERDKKKAQGEKRILGIVLEVVLLVIIILVIIILCLKNRQKNHIIQLQKLLSNVDQLKLELEKSGNVKSKESDLEGKTDGYICTDSNAEPCDNNVQMDETIDPKVNNDINKISEKELRQQLKDRLMTLYENAGTKTVGAHVVLSENINLKIRHHITMNIPIANQDPFWEELEQDVLKASPKFIQNLGLLALHKLTDIDIRTALLIKVGIKPSEMNILFGRSHGAIVSRRLSLCEKVLDQKSGTKVIDGVIRLL